MSKFNYDVFLSYRHKPLDETITKRVFNMLESYRLPKNCTTKAAPTSKGCSATQRNLLCGRF